MPKSTVYLETSVISYLAARPSSEAVIARRQILATQWWDLRRRDFDLVTSQTVLEEAQLGDPEAAERRMLLLADIPLLAMTSDAARLADALMTRMALPTHVKADALHIAVTAINGVHYLLTWNCTHIANAALRPMIEQVCRAHGFEPPIIATPEELLDVPGTQR
jgi:hypothetical protein